jgi:hypothetical protein
MSRGKAFMTRIWSIGLAIVVGVAFAVPAVAAETTDADIMGSDLNSKQKEDFAREAVDELGGSLDLILGMIEVASETNDVILLNCLNEKLGLLRGLHKVAQDAKFGLAESVARENADLQEHNFRKAFIALEQGQAITAEAEACIGQVGTSFPGQTRVVVRFDGAESADTGFGKAGGGYPRPPDSSPVD